MGSTASNPDKLRSLAVTYLSGMSAGADRGTGATQEIQVQSPLRNVAQGGSVLTTMSGALTLTATSKTYQRVDPNGADRNVDLPAEASSEGLPFMIAHTGSSHTITVRDDTPTTITTLEAGEWALVSCDGTAWTVQSLGSLRYREDAGLVAEARLILSAQPSDADTIGIGADTYEFDSDSSVGGGNISVTIGGSAAATLTNLVTAINTSGTENVVADAISGDLRVRSANDTGGEPVGASPSIVLAESITAAADIWRCGNVNMNTLGGAAAGKRRESKGVMTVTAAMVTGEPFTVASFTFTPASWAVQVRDSDGDMRAVTDLFTVANDSIQCNRDGATSVAADDTITFWASE